MKSLLVVLFLTTLTISLKYASEYPSHLQPTQKPLTVAAPVNPAPTPVAPVINPASNTDKGIGEKVKDTLQNETLPSNSEDKTNSTKPEDKIVPSKPEDKITKIDDKQTKPEQSKPQENLKKPEEKSKTEEKPVKPEEKVTKPEENISKPDVKVDKLEEKSAKPEDKAKPAQPTTKPENKDEQAESSTITKVTDLNQEQKRNDPTSRLYNCNEKGRCWKWCGNEEKLSASKDSFHKAADGKWCYTTAENSCKTWDDCKNQTKCVDNCSARWGQ